MEIAFFHRDGAQLVPTDVARSLWSDDQMHGVAISGALGQAAEDSLRGLGRGDLVPSRHTVDLFRPAKMAPCDLVTDVVREGNRLVLVDVRLEQEGELMARASALFLRATEEPPGEVWKRTELPEPPPFDVAPPNSGPRPPLFHSAEGWSPDFLAHQNAEHKVIWNTVPWIVAGEEPSGYAAAAAVADSTTLVTNWGTRGVNYINADVTLTLARRPVSPRSVSTHSTTRPTTGSRWAARWSSTAKAPLAPRSSRPSPTPSAPSTSATPSSGGRVTAARPPSAIPPLGSDPRTFTQIARTFSQAAGTPLREQRTGLPVARRLGACSGSCCSSWSSASWPTSSVRRSWPRCWASPARASTAG
ncbi:acyl-CoA thioesterase domain-containing protein [Nocardioides alcanivorans]|uniref:acyl-CoA thioesterase domain-containing protein n=1 Tax=Nocardioides alcanivorans TaxID=2897352 RepID=UPI001F3D77FA|nr:acyl-CoA thioesterase domain-containing protein [Nocardioides alcanivorans]